MITIIDYGMGNLQSVEKALIHLGFSTKLATSADDVAHAEKLILPGVGAFGDMMKNLHAQNLTGALKEYAQTDRPLLGICLGLQAFFEWSDESPGVEGLGILPGAVKKFDLKQCGKVPHMGWNNLDIVKSDGVFANLPAEPSIYFVHSYYVVAGRDEDIAATCTYGHKFTAAVERGNLCGVQFHPEKSQEIGLRILKNFASK